MLYDGIFASISSCCRNFGKMSYDASSRANEHLCLSFPKLTLYHENTYRAAGQHRRLAIAKCRRYSVALYNFVMLRYLPRASASRLIRASLGRRRHGTTVDGRKARLHGALISYAVADMNWLRPARLSVDGLCMAARVHFSLL